MPGWRLTRRSRARPALDPLPGASSCPSHHFSMDRAWSTRTHEHVREACDAGTQMIEKLASMSGSARLRQQSASQALPLWVSTPQHPTAAPPGHPPLTPTASPALHAAQVYSVAHAFPTYAGHVPLTGV